MKIILANGTELNPIVVTGGPRYVQGASRDCLTFVFAGMSMDELDVLFTEGNCEKVRIITEEDVPAVTESVNEAGETVLTETVQVVETENIHTGYVIRAELGKKAEEVQPATSTTEAVYEDRITVTMAQRTYAESKLVSMSEEITNTQLALCDVYEMMEV